MACIFMTGFEIQSGSSFYAADGYTYTGAGSPSTTGGRYGGVAYLSSVGASTGAGNLEKSFDKTASGTTLVVGLAAYLNGTTTNLNGTTWFACRAGGSQIFGLRLISSGGSWYVRLVSSANGTWVTSAVPYTLATWMYIEVKIVLNASSGTAQLRINGVSQGTFNGNTGTTQPDNWIAVRVGTGGGQTMALALDDIYVLDGSGSVNNDLLGERKITRLAPSAAGNSTQWTPSAGANYAAVDEYPANGDTDYVSDSTVNDVDTYTLGDLPGDAGGVDAVKWYAQARKDDVDTRQIAPVFRISAADYVGASSAGLTTAYAYYTELFDRDPTPADWTVSTVNAMELGVKLVT